MILSCTKNQQFALFCILKVKIVSLIPVTMFFRETTHEALYSTKHIKHVHGQIIQI